MGEKSLIQRILSKEQFSALVSAAKLVEWPHMYQEVTNSIPGWGTGPGFEVGAQEGRCRG